MQSWQGVGTRGLAAADPMAKGREEWRGVGDDIEAATSSKRGLYRFKSTFANKNRSRLT
jgi:hypothetical protein